MSKVRCNIIRWILLTGLFSGIFCSRGQQASNTLGAVTISSPTAASLGKFGDIPVSYHTGIPQVDIPIYTIQAGPLKLPISLSYHASGLKVMEAAGWVGAGWALNAGGVITRTVQGQPDESGANSGSQVDGHFSNYGYNSYLYASSQQDWQGFAQGRKDGEPDLFFFNMGGYAGKFYFRDDRTPILVPQQDLTIIPSYSGGRSIDYFTIITPDGTHYVFGNSPGVTGATPIEITNSYSQKNGAIGAPPTSSWFLNKIVSADNQFTINLSYAAENYGFFTFSMFPIDGTNTGGPDGLVGYDLVKNTMQGVRLSQITFPNGTVNFVAGAVRTDLSDNIQSITDGVNTSATSLGSIQISNTTGFCKNFNFYYGYFSGDNTALPVGLTGGVTLTHDEQRLRLDSLKEASCDSSLKIPPYKFTYYTGSPIAVPRRLSFGIDHWGYFNGQTTNAGLIPTIYVNDSPTAGAVRDASWPQMEQGTLTRIDYPTGGYNSFVFESNTAQVSTLQSYTATLAAFPLNYFGQSALSGSQTFTSNGNLMTASFTTTCNYGGPFNIVNSSNVSVYNITFNNSPNGGNPPVTTTTTINLPAGSYTVTASLPSNVNNLTGGIDITLTQQAEQSVSQQVTVGGMRINNITTSDGVTSNDIVKNFTYNNAGGTSTAVLYSQPTYVQQIRNDLIANAGYWSTTGFTPYTLTTNGCPSTGDYYISPGSIRPMATVQGSIIGYQIVTVSQPGNGYSIYSYYPGNGQYGSVVNGLAIDHVNTNTGCSSATPNYPSAPLPFDSKRGELASEQHYDNTGHLLKDIYYYPVFNETPVLSTPGFIVSGRTLSGTYQLLGTNYTLNTIKKTSMQTVEEDYNPAGGFVTKTSTTYYGSSFHNQPTRTVTTMSTGDSLASNTSYIADLRLSSCDAISDCSATYTSSCSSCQTTYNTARTGCAGSSSCLTTAYLTFMQCNTNARTSYVSCRNTNYMGTTNAFSTCHSSAEGSADNLLKPFLRLQDAFVNAPVEVSEWKDLNLRNASFTQYDTSVSPLAFAYPGRTRTLLLQALSSTFSRVTVSGSTIGLDSRYLDESIYKFSTGNPQQVTPHDGITNAYLWDYKNTQPIAKVVNATVDQIAYTSFEADGTGSWIIGSTNRDTGAITGAQSYYLPSGACSRSGLTSASTYIISYWTTNSSAYTITGTQGSALKGRTSVINGTHWTYFEHTITGQTSVAISGAGQIDELRLYPAGAQMTTYTYQPLLGMTSTGDVDSHISYYEYDKLGRLLNIRDMDYNVLKHYSYQYQVQNIQAP